MGNTPEVTALLTEVLTYKNDIQGELGQCFNLLRRFPKNSPPYRKVLAKIEFLKKTETVCWFKDSKFPTGHLNIIKDVLESENMPYALEDRRVKPKQNEIIRWVNRPKLRYYQTEMVALGLKEGRGVFESCVGSGKSLVAGALIKELSITTLVIVPSVGLGFQLECDFKAWFGAGAVETVTSAKIAKGGPFKPIRIATIQTIASLQKKGALGVLTEDVGVLIVDEVHHAGAASFTNLLNDLDHVYYKFGFTGTYLRNDSKILDLWGFLSNVLYKYPAHKAIAEGFLTPVQFIMHELPGRRSMSYPKEYDYNYCQNPVLLDKVCRLLEGFKPDDQVLILVKNKEKSGAIFHSHLTHAGYECAYISGDDSKEVINGTIRAFNDKRVRILIGSSVIGEGIDIRTTTHLIMCQGGKSEIVMVQAVGRAVRLAENKTLATVHDFKFANTQYMSKHAGQRIEIYRKNFDCEVEIV